MRNLKQGENVGLLFSSVVSTAVPFLINIVDANLNARPLQSFERLILDSIATPDILLKNDGTVTALNGLTLLASTASGVSTLLAFRTAGNSTVFEEFPGEGLALPVGAVLAGNVADTGITALSGSLTINGTGRIVEGTTQGIRPNWRESTVARGL